MQSTTTAREAGSAGSAPRLARLLLAGLGVVLLGLCAWRLACVRAGPDPDTDAYGHFLIARQLLVTPLELRIHWVWLPLYHALVAAQIALGATLAQIRQVNALAAALPPLLLLWTLARGRRKTEAQGSIERAALEPWTLGAALLTAANPLLMQLGTTGQMEVFFCSLLLLVVGLLVWRRFAWAALALSALVLTRYEGWAVAATVGGLLLGRRLLARAALGRGEWACVLAPGACVLAWVTLRRLGGEPWFGFILDNQAFAEHALDGAAAASPSNLPLALARYVALVPWRVFGLAALCAPFGIGPTLRRHGVWLVAPGVAILAFLTLSSLTRSQLGLDRHLCSVVPFAATWIAHGAARLVAALGAVLTPALGGRVARGTAWLGLVPFALSASAHTASGLRSWLDTTREALREQREVARFLRDAPAGARIACPDAAIEVLSELPPGRFWRAPVDRQLVTRLAELTPSGEVIVVQRAGHLREWARDAAVIYGALEGPAQAVVVVRFAAAGSTRAARQGS